MSMKRFGSILLLASIVFSVLCGCTHWENEPIDTLPVTRPNESVTTGDEDVSKDEAEIRDESTTEVDEESGGEIPSVDTLDPASLPSYSGVAYAIVNNNRPLFSAAELTTEAYESYLPLDELGRCREALASCGLEIMPAEDEERGSISSVYPSGWVQAKYDCVSGKYLYNRSHLIGWQLSAENANKSNLITGTRYMNVEGMLPFENMVADYIRETGNHVAYRVTPIFVGDELVCRGVQIEAYSIEDEGEGICFNVYCYNVQPGVVIDYATGESRADDAVPEEDTTVYEESTTEFEESTTVYEESTIEPEESMPEPEESTTSYEDETKLYDEYESRNVGEFDEFETDR